MSQSQFRFEKHEPDVMWSWSIFQSINNRENLMPKNLHLHKISMGQ